MKYQHVIAKNRISGKVGEYHVPCASNMMRSFLVEYEILQLIDEYEAEF